ncbi:hypothetical protein EK904_013645 [Melospiza melodia maxima]|nr:hypothetical protein EK904_013645 [Melospiza melodia maxima]
MPNVSEKTSLNQGAKAARKESAVAAADSPKNKKEQKNQKQVENIKESSVSRTEGVTVYFHAILSKDFKLNPDTDKVFIRAQGIPAYANWKDNICELNCTRSLGEHGYLIEGTVTLSREILDKYIPYKYWVSCGKGDYEFIYKKSESNQHVNRCLLINKALLNNGEWHQYDDIVCARPSKFKNIWQILTFDKTKEVVEGKKIAANIMLESIFSILGTWSPDNLRNFFSQLRQFHNVAGAQRVFDGKATVWRELNFSTEQVNDLLLKYMKKIAVPFLAPEAAPEDRIIQSKLALGLTIVVVVENYSFSVPKSDLADLCSLLCLDQVSPQDVQDEIHHIKQAFAGVTSLKVDLTNLCQRCLECNVEQWVWVLPLLHSFAAPLQQEHGLLEEDAWAGLEGLPFAEIRRKQHGGTLLARMREKKHLMEFDGTLVKSWLCVLPLGSLAEFIRDFSSELLVTLQGVLYRLENVDLSWSRSQSQIEEILNAVLSALDEPPARLHERLCKAARTVSLFLLPASAATLIAKVAQLQPPAVSTKNSWLDASKAWNKFVTISFPDEQFTQTWRNTLLADLKKRIQQEPPVNQILVYCCQHPQITQMDPSISWCFHNCAVEAVPAACQMQSNLLEQISAYNMGQFSQLVSAVIVKSWPVRPGQSEGDFDTILHHLLTWPDIKHTFNFNGTNRNLLDKLTEEAKDVMAIADSVLTSVTDDIHSGCILVKHLEQVFQHQEQFLCIWETKHQQRPSEEKELLQRSLKELLALRHEEVTQLRREEKAVGTFLSMCRKVQKSVRVNVGEVAFQHSKDLRFKRLNQVVVLGKRPLQTFYSLSPELKEFVHKMHSFKDSLIFQQFWEEAAQKAGEEYVCDSPEEDEEEDEDEEEMAPELDLDEVLNSVIRPCFDSYAMLYDDLRSGSLTLSAVDRTFREFTNHPEDLRVELNTICGLQPAEDRGWVDLRVQQIQQYHEMHLTLDAAKIIARVKESLGLSGDFSILENLLHITEKLESYKTQKLDSISPELVQAKKLLQGITVPRRGCLRELAQQKEFVCWVREALKEGVMRAAIELPHTLLTPVCLISDINELKVFVDLASISAGENDMDVDRVACFHGTVHGYSSLLYELRHDSGFEDFMRCLQKLWRALDSDETLPEKLRASAQHLEWLKTVKESHGSVELSSLSLAAAINSRGVYVLRAPADGQKVSLDSVLRFTLPGSSGDTEACWKYSLAELRELQNKLMLMSAKGEQGLEVERFSEVFSNVQRLAQAFIDLYSAGNMLFRSWLAQVYCSPHKESCIFIDFSLGPIPVLEGQGDMAAVLPALCKTMESFLESWKSFMNAKRCEHFYLNYYSAEQLVFLCSELGRGSPSQAALMMLSFLNPHCTEQDVLTALESQGPPSSAQAGSDFQVLLDGEGDLSVRLEHIWECYMSNMGSFLPSCLDMDTLGVWLKNLASRGRDRVTRDFPQDLLCVGQPNLISCPRSEVLSSALAIYMNSPEQPLPTFDEVLLCTPQTSAEQVGLFLRRCLIPCQGGNKIYTMLYADELSYDVSKRAEELFQHLQCYNSSYRLIILCNCEGENSYLPSAFSHYKVHMIPQRPRAEIQQYLQRHFRVPQPSDSAAAVFKEHMCVGIVSSKRAGMGKSLYVKRLHERLQEEQPDCTELLKTIRLIEPEVDEDKVLKSLLPFLKKEHQTKPMIFHFDITSSMSVNQKYHFLDVFPKITCKSPKEVLEMETLGNRAGHVGMDEEEFCSEAFQRPFQYLKRFDQGCNLDRFCYEALSVEGSPAECLQLFLLHCGVVDPSWAELRNFTWFLNVQLRDCEASVFCNPDFVGDTLNGFKNFVVGFMILMARDFATPSLSISDQSSGRRSSHLENVPEEDLLPFRIRKKWESEPHPYLFFNEDRVSMTFIGFHFQQSRNRIDAINPLNGTVIKKDIMTAQLYQGLLMQRVPFNVPFDQLPRNEKLERLCMVLGLPWVFDPDETYELTMDNMLKILAIEMRFRCNIPVVIMGETGCGKTRLVKFLCQLRRSFIEVENMKLVKVHGGTTAEMIYARIREAEALAISNKEQHGLDTVLFFDEANTTEAVSSIKEVLCDRTVQGQPLAPGSGLRIIAACNPYRKHTDRMIQRLELAGLGYRVKADDTREKLGSIPLRQLVYRVHALPPSMIPLVWDFGQLNNCTEKMYIQQIVQRVAEQLPLMTKDDVRTVTEVLFASQQYMRQRDDECSFVSLRDVERCMEVFKWFYRHSPMLLRELEKYLAERKAPKGSSDRNGVIWSLVLAVGVCYHASLEEKEPYRTAISQVLPKPYDTQKKILEEITLMQDLFLSGVPLRDTIARNLALKENVFMMVICIELKIPLFLVGKPGSSKSLAKTIVADAMQGQAAHSDLFKDLKQIHLVSFQCSPLSTPEGIIGTFKHCARFQEGKNLEEYVSVVVLDEIGLAEDSPKMPLKTLHPLLEDGCIDDVPLPHKKVGFIGISNWALDPAKMNRGIFVSRGDPSREELIESAKGICCSARGALQKVEQYFHHFADAYESICKAQNREFFGLRDYYSLIKMFFALAKSSKSEPTPQDIAAVVLRNFSGKDDVNALEIFTSKLLEKGEIRAHDISRIELIRQNIYSSAEDGDCRYLLVLTENYAALQILQQAFFTARQQPEIIFGSSFPKDQEYTQICRNINRVKVCMETGKMVVLLNLQNLYESLYDALNQYYVYLAGQKYVDLGLGTHRVKCRVHPEFRLIVIEEKEVVYKHFPIPLINRLEKHYLDISTVTTFSRLLTSADVACLEREVQGKAQRPQLLFLQQFDTEFSFLKGIRDFLDSTTGNKVLIIQTDFEGGSQNAQLIASAKYTVVNEINKVDLGEASVFVYFIMKLSRLKGGTSYVGFHGGLWQSVHIDDLRRSKDMISDLAALQNLTISQVFSQEPAAARGHAEKFVEYFQKTALGKFISSLTEGERQMLFECYITDFIVLTIGVSSQEELQCLRVAFLSCVEQWVAESPWGQEPVPSLPWAHLAHSRFKSRLQNFSRILAVYPRVLDVLAAMGCAEELEKLVQTAPPELWLQRVKNLHMPIEFLCKEESAQRRGSRCHQLLRELRACWSRVFAMALFVEHVLLGIRALMPEFEGLVRKYTLLLAKCFQHDSDMKSHPTFVAVLTVLCQCKNEVSSRLYRHGLEPCPICLGEPRDPVCLPCTHVFCHKCISQWLVPAQMYCPYCRAALEEVQLTVSEELRAAVAKKALFRQRCNSFFIDMVTTMCFKDNEPPEPEVIQRLLDLLFVHRSLVKDPDHPAVYTKFLSPFNDEVDETPIIRSVMLKLLLKYSFNEVKDDVQRYLSQVEHNELLEKNDKKELYLLFVNCLEVLLVDGNGLLHPRDLPCIGVAKNLLHVDGLVRDELHKEQVRSLQRSGEAFPLTGTSGKVLGMDSMCEKLENSLGCGHGSSVPEDRAFPEHYLPSSSRGAPQEASVQYLQAVAEVRLCLARAAELIFHLQQHTQPEQMRDEQRFLKNVEKFCSRARNDWHCVYLVRRIASQHGMEFAQKLVTEPRFSWVFPAEILQQQAEAMVEFVQSCPALSSPELQHLAVALVKNTLPGLAVGPWGHSQQGALLEMAVHVAAVLLCGHSPVLQPLRNLAFQPHSMQHSFLPTMPEDMMAQARTWKDMHGLHWYECPNGHFSTVGECGLPMETSRCPDCNVPIGGTDHKPVQGFHQSRIREDRTQTGHVLGDVEHRRTLGMSDRGVSPVVFVLLRLLTHLSMLLGASRDPQSLGRMIKPAVEDVVSFLQQHVQEDLAHLTRILGKSVDDTISIVHLVLSSLLQAPQQQPGQWLVQFDEFLSTKGKRNKWEEIVADTIIVPELEDLDKKLLKLNRQIQEDERISSNPIVKLVYGDPAAFLSQLPGDSHVHHSRMWSCRRRVSVENLGHVVQQKNAKDTVPLLCKFLQKENELRLVKFLPEILALQRDLVRQFQNTAEIKHCSIREFLREPHSDVMRDLLERRVNVFLSVWNKLRSSLDTNGEIKLPRGYCDAELSLDSRLEVLLPRRQGLGLCSTALASYLIGLHNDLVHSVHRHTKEDDRYLVSPSEVADLHLISYEVERDLIPLILSNCQYSMEKGGETLQDFDLERIQQQVISKFLQGKPLITLTGIPTLVHRHDRNYEQLFSDVRNKLEQSALPSSVMNMISGELQSYSDVCDALSLSEITLGFLAMAGENADMLLTEYVEQVLQMGDQTNPHVLQVSPEGKTQILLG